MPMTTDNEGVTTVDLPHRPRPEDVARKSFEMQGLSFAAGNRLDEEDLLDFMADAVRLDRRQRLAHRVANARNYAFEATMNEYSQDSIDRSVKVLGELALEVQYEGYLIDDLAVWDGGQWKPVIA